VFYIFVWVFNGLETLGVAQLPLVSTGEMRLKLNQFFLRKLNDNELKHIYSKKVYFHEKHFCVTLFP